MLVSVVSASSMLARTAFASTPGIPRTGATRFDSGKTG
jgi:hypothetical protein